MDSVYRSAKLLKEQLKVGVNLAEFNRLRGNLATELSIVKDRMQAKPRTARLLQPYFSAYSHALDAYSLVGDVWEYRSAMDACKGGGFPNSLSSDAPLNERIHRLEAQGAWLDRSLKCEESAEKASQVLNQRSQQLNTQCGSGVELHLDCIVTNAEGKLTAADKLLMQH